MIEYITKPLTKDEFRAKVKDGRLIIVFGVGE